MKNGVDDARSRIRIGNGCDFEARVLKNACGERADRGQSSASQVPCRTSRPASGRSPNWSPSPNRSRPSRSASATSGSGVGHVAALVDDRLLDRRPGGGERLGQHFTPAAGAEQQESAPVRCRRQRLGQRLGPILLRQQIGAEVILRPRPRPFPGRSRRSCTVRVRADRVDDAATAPENSGRHSHWRRRANRTTPIR